MIKHSTDSTPFDNCLFYLILGEKQKKLLREKQKEKQMLMVSKITTYTAYSIVFSILNESY